MGCSLDYRFRLLTLLLFLALPLPCALSAQESEADDTRFVTVGFDMADVAPESLRVSAGMKLAEFLTLALSWNVGYRTVEGSSATELGVGLECGAELFTQGEALPFTVVVEGAFLKSRYFGDYFDTNELMRSGTSYRVGGTVSRSFLLAETWSFHTSVVGGFLFDNEITEERPGAGTGFVTILDATSDYRIGLEVAAEYRIAPRAKLILGAHAAVNSDLAVIYGPVLTFSS